MRYWYDCEFIEDGRTIDLISIGIVSEDDRELYLVNEKVGRGKLQRRILHHPWLLQNVVPHLPLDMEVSKLSRSQYLGFYVLDANSTAIVPLDYIRRAVREFIVPGPDHPGDVPNPVELWAWCGAYDHVALMQLFGPMVEKPGWFPSYTCDFQYELDEYEIRDEWLPAQTEGQHNALADAKHLKWMMQTLDLDEVRQAYRADRSLQEEDDDATPESRTIG